MNKKMKLRAEQEKAEQQKKHEFYDPQCELEEDEPESCDYTGEECIGNKLFCEECPILTGEYDE